MLCMCLPFKSTVGLHWEYQYFPLPNWIPVLALFRWASTSVGAHMGSASLGMPILPHTHTICSVVWLLLFNIEITYPMPHAICNKSTQGWSPKEYLSDKEYNRPHTFCVSILVSSRHVFRPLPICVSIRHKCVCKCCVCISQFSSFADSMHFNSSAVHHTHFVYSCLG